MEGPSGPRTMNGLDSFASLLDGIVVAVSLTCVTLLVWSRKGRQKHRDDFFLAGRTLSWPLAALSLIATELGVTALLLVPGAMLQWQGDGTHLQWAVGALVARIVVAARLVKPLYDSGEQNPYDYISGRLGRGVGEFAKSLFLVGGLVAHAARLLLSALVLEWLSPLPFGSCVVLIVFLAVLWTVPGGLRSVAWTSAANLALLGLAVSLALWWVVDGFAEGWGTLFSTVRSAEDFDGQLAEKLKVFDFRFGAGLEFTFWTALFAAPFFHSSLLVADPSRAQFLLGCRSASKAGKAVLWSILAEVGVAVLTLLGLALFAFYRLEPPTDPLVLKPLEWAGGEPGKVPFLLPVWFLTEMPGVLRGLLISAFLGMSVSGVNAFLLAFSHLNSVEALRNLPTGWWSRGMMPSRLSVALFGLVLVGCALCLRWEFSLGDFAAWIEAVPHYTAGPLLAFFLAAVGGRGSRGGLLLGAILSMLLVALAQQDLAFLEGGGLLGRALSSLHTALRSGPVAILGALFSSPWGWPSSTLLTLMSGWFGSRDLFKK